MVNTESIFSLEVNSIYNDICELDREFNTKINDSSTSNNYFLKEIIYKTCEIDNRMVMLGCNERAIMAQMLEELISSIDGQISIVISSLYEAICYLNRNNSKEMSYCRKQ